ncbi:MAG: type IV pilin protein [Nitrospinota bacterium]
MKHMKKRGGFTLIELLIVVAIIGILAAIALPQFAQYRKKAVCATMISDVKALLLAQTAYLAENGVYTSNITDPTAPGYPPGWSGWSQINGADSNTYTTPVVLWSNDTELIIGIQNANCNTDTRKVFKYNTGNGTWTTHGAPAPD